MPTYDTSTALIVVDVQNDFADPAGGLSVPGGSDIVPTINAAIETATLEGALVVATQDWHPESTPHFAKDGGIWPVHCVSGSWGSDLYPHLRLPEDAPRIRKGANGEDGYSGFASRDPHSGALVPTELDALLRARAIKRVVVTGLATDYCVKATALDAVRLGYDTELPVNASASVDLEPGDGARAIDEMRAAGVRVLETIQHP